MQFTKVKKRILVALGVCAVIGVTCGGIAFANVSKKSDIIKKGVYIGSVDVGNMNSKQAKKAISEYVDSFKASKYVLQGPNGKIEATPEELGIKVDEEATVNEAKAVGKRGNLIKQYKENQNIKKNKIKIGLKLVANRKKTAKFLQNHKKELSIKAKDMSLIKEGDKFKVVGGQKGKEVDYVKSVYIINNFMADKWDTSNKEIKLAAKVVEPRGNKKELSKVKDLLGSYTTNFSSSSAGRAKNVRNGASKINGTILYPGDEFSVYETVSPFTNENGYELAGSYSNGTVVETFGGGICQVSTTLYNAAIRAELDITMRHNHSMIINYVKPSEDAAIAGTSKDMRFVNNTKSPIYIEGVCNGGNITFNIYGKETRPKNRQISFESQVLSETPAQTEFKIDGGAPLGSFASVQAAHKGYVAQLWKIVTVNGKQKSRNIFNKSSYHAAPKIINVGVAGASGEQVGKIKAAAASKDEGAVRAAVASVKAEIAQAQKNQAEAKAAADAAQAQAAAEAARQQAQQQPQQPVEQPQPQQPVEQPQPAA
ncbi:VanW family protein [Lachnobacterium bovis]|uniref:Vancomycin resistance protein YoaR, contains peptidoglycan-binding and VanW domains n=1 Tax=Lachnobacterium bovis TaxID=140626 RepID=A0A1H9TIL1_9FIRM|nr:VanW family protein [Lachnobacterium bovis]SER97035.1 Vancomycin resistance protein YoaR, contains peptidoglycan-binding and VanW domains [Lachnobacterium bovis]